MITPKQWPDALKSVLCFAVAAVLFAAAPACGTAQRPAVHRDTLELSVVAATQQQVKLDALSVSPAAPQEGQPVRATARLHVTSGTLTAQRIKIAVRDSAGRNLDFTGGLTGYTVTSTPHSFTTAARTFAPGTYRYFASYRYRDVWHPFPAKTFTVSARPVPPGSGPLGVPGSWALARADDFSGTSLNTALWRKNWGGGPGPINSAETACYASDHVTVSGGMLNLALTPGSSCGKAWTGSAVTTDPSDGRESGGWQSSGTTVFEARVFVPADSTGKVSNWPAWWATGQSWPATGEIDIAEGLSGQVCSYYHSSSANDGDCAPGSYAGAWHVYSAQLVPGSKVTWYYDGRVVHTQTSGVAASPLYLVIDNTNGDFGGTKESSTLKVDWVRVWKKA